MFPGTHFCQGYSLRRGSIRLMLRPESLLASLGESHPHGRRRLDPRSFHWRGRPTPVSDLLRARTGSSRDRTRTGWYTTVTGCNPRSEYYSALRLLPPHPPPFGLAYRVGGTLSRHREASHVPAAPPGRPEEFHLQPPTDPDVRLSAHPARANYGVTAFPHSPASEAHWLRPCGWPAASSSSPVPFAPCA